MQYPTSGCQSVVSHRWSTEFQCVNVWMTGCVKRFLPPFDFHTHTDNEVFIMHVLSGSLIMLRGHARPVRIEFLILNKHQEIRGTETI